VEQDGLARLHLVGAPQQILRGHAFQHHRRRGFEGNTLGQDDQAIGRHGAHLGIGAGSAAGISNAIARSDLRDPGPCGLDHAGAFVSHPRRKSDLVQSGALVDVEKIESASLVTHPRLARTGVPDLNVFPFQNFGPALLLDSNRFGHCFSSVNDVCHGLLVPVGRTDYFFDGSSRPAGSEVPGGALPAAFCIAARPVFCISKP